MNLSISNFNPPEKRVRKDAKIWLLTFVFSFCVFLIFSFVTNYCFAGMGRFVYVMRERQLTAVKIFSSEKYNIIFSGSSRINFGIDPDSMKSALPDHRIYNMAMFGGSINHEILTFLESKIDYASSKPKIVIVEFSPRVLWAKLRKNASYMFMKQKSPNEIRQLLCYSPQKRFSGDVLLMPMSRERWNQRRMPETETIPVCHLDTGWYEVINRTGKINNDYKKRQNNMLAEKNLWKEFYSTEQSFKELLEMTKYWRSRGVLVVGIEPPVFSEVKKLEEEVSLFNQQEMITAFQKEGGIFLPIPGNFIPALGSHLESSEAKAYSNAVAQEIRLLLARNILLNKSKSVSMYHKSSKTQVKFVKQLVPAQ